MNLNLDITTPAVMFPAVSLLLLAYTNRFLALAALIRALDPCSNQEDHLEQIANLNKRIKLIKKMQYLGVSSLLLCVVSMFFIFFEINLIGIISFVISLILMIASLVYSLKEINISLDALKIHLNICDEQNKNV